MQKIDPPERSALIDSAGAELIEVDAQLKEKRKQLRRDWETMGGRDRSAGAREVKALEARQRELRQTLEMYAH